MAVFAMLDRKGFETKTLWIIVAVIVILLLTIAGGVVAKTAGEKSEASQGGRFCDVVCSQIRSGFIVDIFTSFADCGC